MKVSDSIPSVLGLPEKFSRLSRRLLKLRLPLERRFTGRDILLCVLATVFLVLSSFKALSGLRLPLRIVSVLAAAVPLCLQALRLIKQRSFPAEETAYLLAAGLCALTRDSMSPALILIFADLLSIAEGYCLLHLDAAPDTLKDAKLPMRQGVERADPEKSPERRALASISFGFFVVFAAAALVPGICVFFHLENYVPWLRRCACFLTLASPSAVLFSSLLTHFGAVFSAAKADICFSDNSVPERFARCGIFVFSKTGTVTDGRFRITEVSPSGMSEQDLLRIAAIAECRSAHPIAEALRAAAGLDPASVPEEAISVKEIPGKGVSAFFSGHQIYVGNAGLLEEHSIWYATPEKSGSAVHVAVDGGWRGYVMISDEIREHAFEALEELRAQGASSVVMLTGDVRSAARRMASSLNFDMVKPELSPEEKASAVRYLRSVHGEKARIACVGDGVHDLEMFDASDVSVCLEPGKDAPQAMVTVDSEDILRIPLAYRICRETERTLFFTAVGLATAKLILAILGVACILTPAAAAGIDCALGVISVIWALTGLTLERRAGT